MLEAARRDDLGGNWQQYQAHLNLLLESYVWTLDQFHGVIEAPKGAS